MMSILRSIKFVVLVAAIFIAAFFSLSLSQTPPQPLSDEEFQKVINSADTLQWAKIVALTDQQAKHLANCDGITCVIGVDRDEIKGLWLKRLGIISDDQAKNLSEHKGYLCLDGLSHLDDKQFKSFGRYVGNYSPRKYVNESIKSLNHMVKLVGGILCLNGLTALTDKQAELLTGCQVVELQLNGLDSITAKQADRLASSWVKLVQLGGLTQLDDSAAKALAQFQGKILFRKLNKESLEAFKKYGGAIAGQSR